MYHIPLTRATHRALVFAHPTCQPLHALNITVNKSSNYICITSKRYHYITGLNMESLSQVSDVSDDALRCLQTGREKRRVKRFLLFAPFKADAPEKRTPHFSNCCKEQNSDRAPLLASSINAALGRVHIRGLSPSFFKPLKKV